MILCAILLRIVGNLLPEGLGREEMVSFLVFTETGRWVSPEKALQKPPTIPTLPPAREVMAQPEEQPRVLTRESAALVELRNDTGYAVDIHSLLSRPQTWCLRSNEPTVLIVHTHGSESYTKMEDYAEDSDYRTLDERYNVISVGARLAETLEAGGIHVIHDKTPYDYPSYSGSYNAARPVIEAYLQENPSICLVLDLHRDAMTDSAGNQVGYIQETGSGTAAKLMLVAGSDAGGLTFPDWQENLSLGLKLQAVLEETCPGICRPLNLRTGRFNQDVFPNMLLVEMGAAGNTRQQALLTAEILAEAVLQMADGVIYQ